jgi:hypothetical protein
MTIGWTKILFCGLFDSQLYDIWSNRAGRPGEDFDPATAVARRPGTTMRIDPDRGFDADRPCRLWARILRESFGESGLREYGQGWREYEVVLATRFVGTIDPETGKLLAVVRLLML